MEESSSMSNEREAIRKLSFAIQALAQRAGGCTRTNNVAVELCEEARELMEDAHGR